MRFLIVSLLTATLFLSSQANAFFGCFSQATGGMANINSGSCGAAQGLWDSYCTQGGCSAHTGYSYGSGFGAYANQIPPACGSASCCNQGGGWWHGGGQRAGCNSCARPASGGGLCSSGGCGAGGCSLGSNLRGLFSRLSCRCRSAGTTWVGGGPLDVYSPVASAGTFTGGVDYGYIDSCSNGGCAGGCGGNAGGEVIMHGEAAPVDGTIISEPTPAH